MNSAPAQEMAGNLSTEADAQRSREGPASSLSRSAMAPSPALAQPDPGARLRAAAAEGRTGEVEMLLDRGTSVDAADSDGDTALMKSVQADHPAVVSLLRRHGASRERKNHAGQSASDLAKAQADTALNRAMGLQPPP